MYLPKEMLLSQRKRPPRSPLFFSLNPERNLILLGTNKGFRVFSLDPVTLKPRLVLQREGEGYVEQDNDERMQGVSLAAGSRSNLFMQQPGGIGSVDVLASSNLFCLVGGGRLARQALEKLLVWDDAAGKILMEMDFNSPVKSAFLKMVGLKILLFVLFTTKTVVYSLEILQDPPQCTKMYEFEMYWNEFSAFGLSNGSGGEENTCVFAIPSRNKGQLQIVDITDVPSIPLTTICSGHDHAITCIAVSNNGHLVATSSSRGTLVRVWHTKSGTLRHELRRGTDEAEIYSMAFDSLGSKLCVSSDKGTIHIFNLSALMEKKPTITSTYLPKYFSSDWSFSFCSIPFLSRCIVKFKESEFGSDTPSNTILVVCDDGSLYTITFDLVKGGEASISQLFKFYSF